MRARSTTASLPPLVLEGAPAGVPAGAPAGVPAGVPAGEPREVFSDKPFSDEAFLDGLFSDKSFSEGTFSEPSLVETSPEAAAPPPEAAVEANGFAGLLSADLGVLCGVVWGPGSDRDRRLELLLPPVVKMCSEPGGRSEISLPRIVDFFPLPVAVPILLLRLDAPVKLPACGTNTHRVVLELYINLLDKVQNRAVLVT